MTAVKCTGVSATPSKNRIISTETKKTLFKFHWYVEYMLIGMALLIAIAKTTELLFSELPRHFLAINIDFLIASLGVLLGLALARRHSKRMNNT